MKFIEKYKLNRLNKRHKQLLKEAFELSKTNRKLSDEKYAEAEKILVEIERVSN